MTPLRSCANCSDSASAYFWESVSPPLMPATIRPDLPSLLTSEAAAAGGTVHAEVTLVTCADVAQLFGDVRADCAGRGARRRRPVRTRRTAAARRPGRTCPSRILVALADSDVGSWNPPADRLLATGMPKMPAATISSAAMARVRLGAAIASRAMRCSRPPRTGERRPQSYESRCWTVRCRRSWDHRPSRVRFQHSVTFVNNR